MRIKRIHTFMLQTFVPLFVMTFFICLFIVLMQFLWRYVDDLVGKGLEIGVLAELFFYAAMVYVPLALPLGILLASLMVFGNLGESLELLAMKASGISLIRIMKPLTFFMIILSIGTFVFQDRVLPYVNTKMYSILLGIKHTSPELEIPEGVFYKEINDYNIYVGRKDYETGLLHDVTIYIFEGVSIEDATVTTADSARISMAETGRHLCLTLWSGEQVGTFRNNGDNYQTRQQHPKYRREKFVEKQVYIPYDHSFEATDESVISDRHVGKNLVQLAHSVDSLFTRIDSIDTGYGKRLRERTYFINIPEDHRNDSAYFAATTGAFTAADDPRLGQAPGKPVSTKALPINIDSLYASLQPEQMERIVKKAQQMSNNVVQTFSIQKEMQAYEAKNLNYHAIEIHRKFTLSIACLLFFFIGAPLGAIIRKGGLGVPIITGVLFFIIYFVIDNFGYKEAKAGDMEPWSGIWLSSMVLAPISIWLTWKAINDAPLFDLDTYKIRFHHAWRWLRTESEELRRGNLKFLGQKKSRKFHLTSKRK